MKYKVFCSALPGSWSQVATEEEALELDNRLGKDWRDGESMAIQERNLR